MWFHAKANLWQHTSHLIEWIHNCRTAYEKFKPIAAKDVNPMILSSPYKTRRSKRQQSVAALDAVFGGRHG